MAKRILVLAIAAVFLSGCATSGYGVHTPLGSVRTSDLLCATLGAGAGYGVSTATSTAGGVITGAGVGLACKWLADRMQGPDQVHGHPPVVSHHPGVVTIPSPAVVPEGYDLRQINALNATKGTIFVRTPQGMHRVEPGGSVMFYEYVSGGAGGAFYKVYAIAAVSVQGGYQSKWAESFTSNNGTLTYTAEFKDFQWDHKIVLAYAAERHGWVPPAVVNQAPSVGAPSVPTPPALPPRQ